MTLPADYSEREQALDIKNSYIVQAPAGSGKTELLTQRYLALLAQAQHPEEILAITFTRKAAGEMRERIIHALQLAKKPCPDGYLETTWKLAKAVLDRQALMAWQLLDNPNRLRIQTIDALCASITRQMPILSRLGVQPDVTDDTTELYLQAVKAILTNLEQDTPWTPALTTLLLHLDNNYENVQNLLCSMLARRDQWLPYIAGAHNQSNELRKVLERGLQEAIRENLIRLKNSFSNHSAIELINIAQFAGQQVQKSNPESAIASCANLINLPDTHVEQLKNWLGITDILLTNSGDWRKKLTKNEGFPAQNEAKTADEKSLFTQMKQRAAELIMQFAEDDNLHQRLLDLRALPPSHYTDAQWEIIMALLQLLPILVAQLQLVFQTRATVDHTEIAQSALMALGDPQAPSDLALAMDYRIQHILVDEFQDTSIAQFRLLEQLTAGWQPYDGHTLFLVGDPMQSIYRFRKAEVGLFLQARESGIGNIQLTPLKLTVNFRSTPEVVDWINNTFTALMPAQEDISIGAVTYTPSSSNKITTGLTETPAVNLFPVHNMQEEGKTTVSIIQQTYLNNPEASIAILVRARTHLLTLLPALQTANIPYRAIEIETLSQRPHIQDLFALTRALLHLGDRIAWLAILRAPWCGLSLADLHKIAHVDHKVTIWEQLKKINSDDYTQRLKHLIETLTYSLSQRQRMPFAQWVEGAWLALGGPACLPNATALKDTKMYFKLLAEMQTASSLPDIDALEKQLKKLYAATNTTNGPAVEVMTIHKAKGLEFDCVILPSLDRRAAGDSPQLLMCMERPTAFGHTDLLLAPIKSAADDEQDPIYAYLYHEEKKRAENEVIRLLYVAATRAKKSLNLIATLKGVEGHPTLVNAPEANSLLAQLWPALSMEFMQNWRNDDLAKNVMNNDLEKSIMLRRLTANWKLPIFEETEN